MGCSRSRLPVPSGSLLFVPQSRSLFPIFCPSSFPNLGPQPYPDSLSFSPSHRKKEQERTGKTNSAERANFVLAIHCNSSGPPSLSPTRLLSQASSNRRVASCVPRSGRVHLDIPENGLPDPPVHSDSIPPASPLWLLLLEAPYRCPRCHLLVWSIRADHPDPDPPSDPLSTCVHGELAKKHAINRPRLCIAPSTQHQAPQAPPSPIPRPSR